MSNYSPNAAGPSLDQSLDQSLGQSLSQSVAALVLELTRMKHDLTALRARMVGPATSLQPREALFSLEEIAQWIGIAPEMEQTYDKHTRRTSVDSRARALDLDAARLSIGGKLDRLRAAQRAERLPECAD